MKINRPPANYHSSKSATGAHHFAAKPVDRGEEIQKQYRQYYSNCDLPSKQNSDLQNYQRPYKFETAFKNPFSSQNSARSGTASAVAAPSGYAPTHSRSLVSSAQGYNSNRENRLYQQFNQHVCKPSKETHDFYVHHSQQQVHPDPARSHSSMEATIFQVSHVGNTIQGNTVQGTHEGSIDTSGKPNKILVLDQVKDASKQSEERAQKKKSKTRLKHRKSSKNLLAEVDSARREAESARISRTSSNAPKLQLTSRSQLSSARGSKLNLSVKNQPKNITKLVIRNRSRGGSTRQTPKSATMTSRPNLKSQASKHSRQPQRDLLSKSLQISQGQRTRSPTGKSQFLKIEAAQKTIKENSSPSSPVTKGFSTSPSKESIYYHQQEADEEPSCGKFIDQNPSRKTMDLPSNPRLGDSSNRPQTGGNYWSRNSNTNDLGSTMKKSSTARLPQNTLKTIQKLQAIAQQSSGGDLPAQSSRHSSLPQEAFDIIDIDLRKQPSRQQVSGYLGLSSTGVNPKKSSQSSHFSKASIGSQPANIPPLPLVALDGIFSKWKGLQDAGTELLSSINEKIKEPIRAFGRDLTNTIQQNMPTEVQDVQLAQTARPPQKYLEDSPGTFMPTLSSEPSRHHRSKKHSLMQDPFLLILDSEAKAAKHHHSTQIQSVSSDSHQQVSNVPSRKPINQFHCKSLIKKYTDSVPDHHYASQQQPPRMRPGDSSYDQPLDQQDDTPIFVQREAIQTPKGSLTVIQAAPSAMEQTAQSAQKARVTVENSRATSERKSNYIQVLDQMNLQVDLGFGRNIMNALISESEPQPPVVQTIIEANQVSATLKGRHLEVPPALLDEQRHRHIRSNSNLSEFQASAKSPSSKKSENNLGPLETLPIGYQYSSGVHKRGSENKIALVKVLPQEIESSFMKEQPGPKPVHSRNKISADITHSRPIEAGSSSNNKLAATQRVGGNSRMDEANSCFNIMVTPDQGPSEIQFQVEQLRNNQERYRKQLEMAAAQEEEKATSTSDNKALIASELTSISKVQHQQVMTSSDGRKVTSEGAIYEYQENKTPEMGQSPVHQQNRDSHQEEKSFLDTSIVQKPPTSSGFSHPRQSLEQFKEFEKLCQQHPQEDPLLDDPTPAWHPSEEKDQPITEKEEADKENQPGAFLAEDADAGEGLEATNSQTFPSQVESTPNLQTEHFQQTLNTMLNLHLLLPYEESYKMLPPVHLPEPSEEVKACWTAVDGSQIAPKVLFIDIDETMIHCIDDRDPSDLKGEFKISVALNHTESKQPFQQLNSLEIELNVRPGLVDVLKKLKSQYQLVSFTASDRVYADAIIDFIDPTRELFSCRLYRENCVETEYGLIKDLRVISNRSLADMISVDNSALSFGFNVLNGIPILPFYNNKEDIELKHLSFYLNNLCQEKVIDVRHNNEQAFGLTSLVQNTFSNSNSVEGDSSGVPPSATAAQPGGDSAVEHHHKVPSTIKQRLAQLGMHQIIEERSIEEEDHTSSSQKRRRQPMIHIDSRVSINSSEGAQ